MAKSFKRNISKLFQVAGVRVETDLANMQDNDFVVISRGNNGSDTNRRLINDQQFFLRWDQFVQFLQGATTDKFVDAVTLAGRTLVFTYNNGDPDLNVDLNPLGLVDSMSFAGTILSLQRSGGLSDLTVDISDVLDGALTNVSLQNNTDLTFTYGNGANLVVDLTPAQDGVVTGATLNGTILELSRSGSLVDVTVDLQPIQDGVVTGASVSGTDLILTRSAGLGDITVDLAPAVSAANVQIITTAYTTNQTRFMTPTNRSVLLDNAALGSSRGVHVLSALAYATTTPYNNTIDVRISMSPNTGGSGGVDIATPTLAGLGDNELYGQAPATPQSFARRESDFDIRVYHDTNLSGDVGQGITVSLVYNLVP